MKNKTKDFIFKSQKLKGNIYDYSQTEYKGYDKKINIICYKHGIFTTTPRQHLRSFTHGGCIKCYKQKGSPKRKNTNWFIKQSNKVHNNKYDYSKTKYIKSSDQVIIICPIHGEFKQIANNHLRGMGCPTCSGKNITTKDFIQRSTIVHNNKYDYSKSKYIANNKPIKIICPIHGEFNQLVNDHMNNKHGCPKCGGRLSIAQRDIVDYIKYHNVCVQENVSNLIKHGEIDIYVPEKNLAIEYGGVYWHTERTNRGRQYHITKTNECEKQNIQLLTIFSDEWLHHKDIILNTIKHKLNLADNKIYARQTKIIETSTKEKRIFFNNFHIQGNGPSSVNVGLIYKSELVAVMGFYKNKNNVWYLNRYTTKYHIVGGFTKLLNWFCNNYKWSKLITFADRRWSSGLLYKRTGWTLDKVLPPDYRYVPDNINRIHKFNYRREHLPKLLTMFDPNKSEYQNCLDNQIYRIWDCGKLRYIINN